MSIIRQYIAPLIAVILFLFALVVVSYRIFLPSDLAAPAPVEEVSASENQAMGEGLNPSPLSLLTRLNPMV